MCTEIFLGSRNAICENDYVQTLLSSVFTKLNYWLFF